MITTVQSSRRSGSGSPQLRTSPPRADDDVNWAMISRRQPNSERAHPSRTAQRARPGGSGARRSSRPHPARSSACITVRKSWPTAMARRAELHPGERGVNGVCRRPSRFLTPDRGGDVLPLRSTVDGGNGRNEPVSFTTGEPAAGPSELCGRFGVGTPTLTTVEVRLPTGRGVRCEVRHGEDFTSAWIGELKGVGGGRGTALRQCAPRVFRHVALRPVFDAGDCELGAKACDRRGLRSRGGSVRSIRSQTRRALDPWFRGAETLPPRTAQSSPKTGCRRLPWRPNRTGTVCRAMGCHRRHRRPCQRRSCLLQQWNHSFVSHPPVSRAGRERPLQPAS